MASDLAGGTAERFYRSSLRGWRHAFLRPVAWATWPVVAICALLAPLLDGYWLWVSGLMSGCSLTFYLLARDWTPEYIERWALGAEGERKTAAELQRLPESWAVYHDIPTARGNWDHVVVGPGGVFVIDSKQLQGSVVVAGDVVEVKRRHDPIGGYREDRIAVHVQAAAVELKGAIRIATQMPLWVTPVVVFWGRFEQKLHEGHRAVFVCGDELVDWLSRRDQVLPQGAVDRLITHADSILTACGKTHDNIR